MPVSLSEAAQTLLSGNVLSWAKFGEYKAGSVQLASPGARRLLHYLMSCDRTKVADAREDLFAGLVAAWQNTAIDPATTTKPIRETAHTGTWQLVRLESAGFGGLNLVDGPNLVLALNGERDLQVLPKENLARIQKALEDGGNGDFQTNELPGLNHLFQHAPTGAPTEYGAIVETMAPEALNAISEWVLKRGSP